MSNTRYVFFSSIIPGFGGCIQKNEHELQDFGIDKRATFLSLFATLDSRKTTTEDMKKIDLSRRAEKWPFVGTCGLL